MSKSTSVSILSTSTQEGWDLVARKAQALSESSIIPETYRNNPQNVLVAMEMAERTNIPVLAVMQNLFVIQGKPSWSAQFLIASVNRSGRFSPLRFHFEGTEGKDDWGCRAAAMDLSDGEELVGTLVNMKMAKAEGWSTKSGSKWLTMPDQMLRYRAAAFWARVYSPELAVGLHTVEENEDIGPSANDRVKQVASALDGDDDNDDIPEVVVTEVVVTEVVADSPPKKQEEHGKPLTKGQTDRLRGLMDSCDLDFEEAQHYEQLVTDKNGPAVRQAIVELQKRSLELEL